MPWRRSLFGLVPTSTSPRQVHVPPGAVCQPANEPGSRMDVNCGPVAQATMDNAHSNERAFIAPAS